MTSLVDKVAANLKERPHLLKNRGFWYTLRSLSDNVMNECGLGAAMGFSAELYSRVTESPHGAYTLAHDAQLILTDPDAIDLGECNRLFETGALAGRPYWYHRAAWARLWLAGTADTSRVAQSWGEGTEQAKPRDKAFVDELYRDFCAMPNPQRDALGELLMQFMRERNAYPRVLDIGMGYGNWLRWMRDTFRIPASRLWGCDPLPARVEAARLLLADSGIPEAQTFRLLPDFPTPQNADIIVLAAVTGTMQDDDLRAFCDRLKGASAEFIFETHALDGTSTWVGRENSDAFFERAAYAPVRAVLCGDALTPETLHRLVCPAKYYLAGRACIYRKET